MRWPLIGRSEEMRAIQAAILASDVSGIVVYGAAGVGKSRIAREALSAAESHGCEGRLAVGTSSARAIPLGVFSAWAPSGVTDTVQLLRGVIELLTAASSDAAVVVGVDDVHLLDDLSIFVVHQIVQRGAAKVILTVRDGEPIPAAVQEIWKGGRFDRLDLQPLSLDETSTLLSATLDGPVDPDAAQRLWNLTRGNVLYLRNIVDQEVADGRLVQQHGYWRWTGDPIMPPGLVELIESRIGALPAPVSDVVDALAVGEPIELAALRRITDPAAVEEADTRGLITLEPAVGGVEVRVAHPLYGEVRRRRAAPTRLRRLRGLVAAELAAADDRDDIQVVVRRATLSLDSDLTPDADLLVRAAQGAVWLADLALADRLAEAAVRAGGGTGAEFCSRACTFVAGPGRGGRRGACRDSHRRVDRRATAPDWRSFGQATCSGRSVTLRARKKSSTRRRAPHHRRRAAISMPSSRCTGLRRTSRMRRSQASEKLALDDLPAVVGAEIAWVLAAISADAGRTTEAVAVADAGYTVAARSFDAPHMRFNIADAHISALLLAGRVAEALEVAERVRQQAADLPGAAQLLGCRRGGSGRAWCRPPRYRMCDVGTGGRGIVRLACHRLGVPLSHPAHDCTRDARFNCARRRPRLPRWTSCDVRSGRSTMKGAWPGRGWSRARAPSVRRSLSCCRRPKGLQPTGNSRPKWSACRPPPSSVTVPAHPDCASSKSIVEGPRVGLAARFVDRPA